MSILYVYSILHIFMYVYKLAMRACLINNRMLVRAVDAVHVVINVFLYRSEITQQRRTFNDCWYFLLTM